jgi:enoyl-CoA hydratase
MVLSIVWLALNSSHSGERVTSIPHNMLYYQSHALYFLRKQAKEKNADMEEYTYILVERAERIAIVTLNRPKELNALSTQVVGELADALEDLDRDEAINCIIITGAGEKAFAAGADIKEMADKTPIDMLTGNFNSWARIRRIRTPLIAAVNGYALGGGCELALHCDMIVASENARFSQPEISIGVIPGAGGTQRLARVLGKYRTMEMVLTGTQVTAQELAELGMVNRVVPQAELLDTAKKLALKVASQPPIAAQLAKDAVLAAFETTLEQGLDHEVKNFFLLFASEDMREGMRAFIEKRKPDFKGK